jgi:hypothetical protein
MRRAGDGKVMRRTEEEDHYMNWEEREGVDDRDQKYSKILQRI